MKNSTDLIDDILLLDLRFSFKSKTNKMYSLYLRGRHT